MAAKVGLLSLPVVPQQQCNGHCPCDSICPARQLKQQLRGVLVAAQWRGDTALTLPLFWRRSTVSSVFFGRYPRSSLHTFVLPPPPHPLPPSLISILASVDVKQNGQGQSPTTLPSLGWVLRTQKLRVRWVLRTQKLSVRLPRAKRFPEPEQKRITAFFVYVSPKLSDFLSFVSQGI